MKKLVSLLPCAILALTSPILAQAVTTPEPTDAIIVGWDENVNFPDPRKTYLKELPRYDPIELIHIDRGINDDTARQLIGNPHFSEFMSSNWNYIFAIRQPNSRDYIECQLQLQFDKDDIVENYYWNSPQCATLVNDALKPLPAPTPIAAPVVQPAPIVVAKPAPVEPPKVRKFTLSSDLLFDFDSATLKSSSALSISRMTAKIEQEYSDIQAINVIGHTDYLGDLQYNQRLSIQRANTVANELVNRGFNPAIITVSGMGESAPLTNNCTNMTLKQVKLCLAPDRRVEVQVTGDLK